MDNNAVFDTMLPNGLQIRLKEIHTIPMISHWVWYRVGSRDEPTGRTGISHWVEHMQFKGTPQFPAGTLDTIIARAGGLWNALTFQDWTTYYEVMPADQIDLALYLEADRMLNALYDPEEVEAERTVVISEREGEENEPTFRLAEELGAAAFRVHPYHHEIIGDMADILTIQRDDLYRHYRSYYTPQNAIISIAGDFDSETVLARLQALYADIPAGEEPSRLVRPEPPQCGERRIQLKGPGETTYIQTAYHVPAASHPDFLALMALDSLLSGPSSLNMFGGGGVSNKTSRLYRALVEKEIAINTYGTLLATIDPYLYGIAFTLHPDHKADEAIAVLDDELKRLQDSPPKPDELARALKQSKALFAYGSETITNQAFWLGFAEMFDNYDWFIHYLDKLEAVTPADVQRVAQTYLTPGNRTLGIYLPE